MGDGSVAGYFPDSTPDLAVLAISSFLPSGSPLNVTSNFQSVLRQFLDTASRAQETRVITDLRGNGSGYGFLAHDLFCQLFPNANPYDASNYRANRLFDLTGQAVSELYGDRTPADYFVPERAPPLFSGPYPFNYRQQLDIKISTFSSWADFFGPQSVSSSKDNLTAVTRPDLNDPFQTGFPIYPLGDRVIAEPVFSPSNIVILQDGGGASACILFSEFMKMNAPGPGTVQSTVVSGRRQGGTNASYRRSQRWSIERYGRDRSSRALRPGEWHSCATAGVCKQIRRRAACIDTCSSRSRQCAFEQRDRDAASQC